MTINKQVKEDSLVLQVEGRLDTTTAPALEQELQKVVEETDYLIFDFAELEYISSAGLRVLLSAQKIMEKKGQMEIQNVCEEVMEVFEITGFEDILTIV